MPYPAPSFGLPPSPEWHEAQTGAIRLSHLPRQPLGLGISSSRLPGCPPSHRCPYIIDLDCDMLGTDTCRREIMLTSEHAVPRETSCKQPWNFGWPKQLLLGLVNERANGWPRAPSGPHGGLREAHIGCGSSHKTVHALRTVEHLLRLFARAQELVPSQKQESQEADRGQGHAGRARGPGGRLSVTITIPAPEPPCYPPGPIP